MGEREKSYVVDTHRALCITAFINIEETQLFQSSFLLDFFMDIEPLMSFLFVQNYTLLLISAIAIYLLPV